MSDRPPGGLREVAVVFAKLGVIGFGGPAAHIALMHTEVVERRRWVSASEFLDLVAAAHLIPGPNSTELAIHLGRRRAGWRGLLVAGGCFIAPAAAIVLASAWLYVRYGTTPAGEGILYGIVPVVVAIVVHALWRLGRDAVKDVPTVVVPVAAFAGFLLGVHELAVLFGGGAVVLAARRLWTGTAAAVAWFGAQTAAADVGLARLGWVFVKVGALLYGSGYVLLAFLQRDLVERLGWLTERQLLDAIAVGQFTPGPVFTTATFVGFVVAGWAGAAVATVGIFGPSFVFVALTAPLVDRARSSAVVSAILDGVVAASLGLMAAVTVQLAASAFVDAPTVAVGVVTLAVLVRWGPNPAWLVAAGAVVGLVRVLVF